LQDPEDQLLATAQQATAHWTQPLTPREGDGAANGGDGKIILKKQGSDVLPWKDDAFCEIDPAPLLELIEDPKADERVYARTLEEFHQAGAPLLPSAAAWAYLLSLEEVRFGIHLQPLNICQILCSPRARQFADRRTSPNEVTSTGGAAVLVPYSDPGIEFARDLKRKVVYWRSRFKEVPAILFYQNNGIVLLGGAVEDVIRRLDDLSRHAQIFVGAAMLGGPVFLTPTNVEKLQRSHGLPLFGLGNLSTEKQV